MTSGLERKREEAGAQREVPSQPVHERTKEYEKHQQGHSVLHPRCQPGIFQTQATSITCSANLFGAKLYLLL